MGPRSLAHVELETCASLAKGFRDGGHTGMHGTPAAAERQRAGEGPVTAQLTRAVRRSDQFSCRSFRSDPTHGGRALASAENNDDVGSDTCDA